MSLYTVHPYTEYNSASAKFAFEDIITSLSFPGQAGTLHASEEKDFKTAFSYFYEAFEQYDSVDDANALTALKYMLMTKIMLGLPEDVLSLVSGKLALKYSGSQIEAMKEISQAAKRRSLADFQRTLGQYKRELEDDRIVNKHLGKLYQSMLEKNLCRIIEPYSKVQVRTETDSTVTE